jgi:hypothetical protein
VRDDQRRRPQVSVALRWSYENPETLRRADAADDVDNLYMKLKELIVDELQVEEAPDRARFELVVLGQEVVAAN